jgi:hypothetical protein
MTRHHWRLRAFTRTELQTVGYLSGLSILVWWAFTDSDPNPAVVASVTSLLVVQRYVGGRSKESNNGAMGEVQDVAGSPKRGNKRAGSRGGGGTGGGSRRHHLRAALNRRWPPTVLSDGAG